MAYQDDVQQLFQQQLGREADSSGMAYYTDRMNNGWSVQDVVNAMQSSPEAQSRGSTPSYTTPTQTSTNYPSWMDLISQADNTLSRNGDSYANNIYVPGLGTLNVTRGDGQTYGTSGITGLQLHDPSRDGQGLGGGFSLTPNADGTFSKTSYDYKNGFWDYALPLLSAAVTAGGLSGAIPSTLGASGTAAGGTAGGWLSAEGGAGYIGGAAADASELAALTGGLDVSHLGLDQFTEGLPNIETLGTTAEGGLAYPGDAGYIPPGTPINPNYSNEGKNYPTPASTVNSPINSPAPTIDLNTPNIKVPGITTPNLGSGGGGKSGSGGLDLGSLIGMLYGAYGKNNMANQLQGYLDQITNMYKPGSPEAELMRKKIEARDAAAGRRSQYGPRETELAGMLAHSRMQALTSPGFMTMQAAMMNNSPSMGGLSELLAALSGGDSNLGININDIFNTGLLDGEGWISNLFS